MIFFRIFPIHDPLFFYISAHVRYDNESYESWMHALGGMYRAFAPESGSESDSSADGVTANDTKASEAPDIWARRLLYSIS
jgi:hypothetical protein